MRAAGVVLGLAALLALAGNLLAADGKKPAEGKHREAPAFSFLKDVELTADQQAKVNEIRKECGRKLKALHEKRDGIVTADQNKAAKEAAKEAKAAGKKQPEVLKAAVEAMKLTDDQKAKIKEVGKESRAVSKEAREKVMSILTAEQKEKIEQKAKERRKQRQERKSEA
ncbi:MAG: hypothetical protein ABFC96_12835 [Thermoguttaceae bacterium]